MKHTPPPPPPRWYWFAAVSGLALLASLTIAAGRDPPGGAHALAEPTRGTGSAGSADELWSPTLFDSSPAFDGRCLICQQPLY